MKIISFASTAVLALLASVLSLGAALDPATRFLA